ncbi:class I SAM-dependent methyltransferase [Solirubrobacter deserti]|uniref:Class I SAM-dependent methyltransferase n=1 Tax=Solirubrobacter deserti TaxID=2282478 RepID=A0ABT4RIM0_9ACTN|nr:class I SAM-dependent methyltransferase [Solirubrobacter deserti]MDA0138363.1 class I SAM-dependent methyltransferase [Solirubrobacter deserti]
MNSREEALSFPTGDLRLGFCAACGFITNTLYDAALQDYGIGNEASQGFSPTFNAFSKELARRWVERYGLEGKGVLEIGSGKGEFLVDMIEAGAGHAVGVDPALLDERLDPALADRISFIKEHYSERHGALTGDAVVCRHTLEHIGPVLDFVSIITRSLEGRPDTAVLFELPDVGRVLRECAFWDIYYEHCSYFTPGSLARLYRKAGLDVLDLELDYDDQYILIEGRPATGAPNAPLALEETPEAVAADVAAFVRDFEATRTAWQDRVRSARADGRRTVLWGGGSKGVAFLTTLGLSAEVDFVVDVNPFKQDKFMAGTGHEVSSPERLRTEQPDLVVAMNPIYLEEIGADLHRFGVNAELVAV